jgi:hypothetical protein
MAEIRVRPLRPEHIDEAAAYLAGLRREELPANAPFDLAAETRAIATRMRWQLVDNPARLPDAPGGHVLRDAGDRVVGTHLAIPVRFAAGARRLLGLLSADLRAEPEAARHSGGMFLAYLRIPGADFHYATTANRNAGAFWEQRRATAVAGSDCEHIAPVKLGPFLEELAARRRLAPAAQRAARALGAGAGWLLRVREWTGRSRRSGKLAVQPTLDWERLAAFAERHRAPGELTNERSASYLRWRYAECPGSERNRVLWVEAGAEQAWAAVQLATVGASRLREARLMDVVWARETTDPADVLRAVFDRCRDECDMVRVKGGTVSEAVARELGLRLRRLDGPTSYVAGVDGVTARLVAADSDTP